MQTTPYSIYLPGSSPGSLAILLAMRRASSIVSTFAMSASDRVPALEN